MLLYKGQRRSRHSLNDLLADNARQQGSLDSTSTRADSEAVESQGGGTEKKKKEEQAGSEKVVKGEDDILLTFFKPVSEKEDKRRRKLQAELHLPQQVTGETFQLDVRPTHGLSPSE